MGRGRGARERAIAAITQANTLAEARALYGIPSRDALLRVVYWYPELKEAYYALPNNSSSPETQKLATEANVRKGAERRRALIEDVEDLISAGASYQEIARRVGKSPGALAKYLDRAERSDLRQRMGLTYQEAKKSYQTKRNETN